MPNEGILAPRQIALPIEDGCVGACHNATRAVVLRRTPIGNAVVEERFDRLIEGMRPRDIGESVSNVDLPLRGGGFCPAQDLGEADVPMSSGSLRRRGKEQGVAVRPARRPL